MIQRELAITPEQHFSSVSLDGSTLVTTYTIDRSSWVQVVRVVIDTERPIGVTAMSMDATCEIQQFPNSDDGWDEANAFVQRLFLAMNLQGRADTQADHYISAAKAALQRARRRMVA